MLTLAKVATGSAAASYYESSNDYYHKGADPSNWHGAGARKLGLDGTVDIDVFRELLNGRMPDGRMVHNGAEGRLGGIDFTLSAPKSVSMQALIGGDVRLVAAHERAVARTMQYAETLANYRVTTNRVTERERSGNLIIATFRHDLSRAKDPNLHSHSVVINATQRPDGEWRALHHLDFFKQKMLMGALYRSELALEVRGLGYDVRLTHLDGRFELAHISSRQIDAFSTRSKEIEAALAAEGKSRGTSTAREKEVANLATRNSKVEVDRGELHRQWRSLSETLTVDYGPTLKPVTLDPEVRADAARDAISYAIAHATERQSVVAATAVLRHALERGTGRTDLSSLRGGLEQQLSEQRLVAKGDQYTTCEAQQREHEILAVAARGRGAVSEITDSATIHRGLAGTSLNEGQRAAVELILSTGDRATAVQGAAGTGKTTMLKQATALAKASGFQVLGAAPSAAAARELAKADMPTMTVAALLSKPSAALNGKSLLVVDEAGMISAKDMHALLHAVESVNARIVLVGDVQQLKAVEAGRPFAQLQEAGLARVEMAEIQRQTDARLQQAVELAYAGHIRQSVELLNRDIIEIADTEERHARIAHDYAALGAIGRAATLVVAGTRSAVASINAKVREELQLAGEGVEVNILSRKDLTRPQARSSLSYTPGDRVQALKSYSSLGLKAGEVAMVVDTSPGKVTLSRANGALAVWRPAIEMSMAIFKAEVREMSVGDRARVTANDHAAGLINGDQATISAIDQSRQTLLLQMDDGRSLEVNYAKPVHLDYAYCSTVHTAQGATATRVLIDADTTSVTSHEGMYYTAVSRARESATLYTDDRESLPIAMGRPDSKHAALDLESPTNRIQLER